MSGFGAAVGGQQLCQGWGGCEGASTIRKEIRRATLRLGPEMELPVYSGIWGIRS